MLDYKTLLPQKLVSTFGLLLMALSPFLVWISASTVLLSGLTLSRTGLEFIPEIGVLAFIFLAGGGLLVWFYNKPRNSGIVCLLMALWMFFEVFVTYPQLESRVTEAQENVIVLIGPGIYLLATGAFLTFVGGITLITGTKQQQKTQVNNSLPQPLIP